MLQTDAPFLLHFPKITKCLFCAIMYIFILSRKPESEDTGLETVFHRLPSAFSDVSDGFVVISA